MPNDHWLIYQLADSAFPAGGFAHSGGLESAWRHGRVSDIKSFEEYLRCQLTQLARGSVPFVLAAYDSPEQLDEWDDACDIVLTNHVANRASRAQGQAFLLAASRIFEAQGTPNTIAGYRTARKPRHFAPSFGAVLRSLKVERSQAGRLFCFIGLRGLVSAAVRLGIAGPLEAQTVQWRVSDAAATVLQRADEYNIDQVAQTTPLLDLMCASHDRLYSRLFQT